MRKIRKYWNGGLSANAFGPLANSPIISMEQFDNELQQDNPLNMNLLTTSLTNHLNPLTRITQSSRSGGFGNFLKGLDSNSVSAGISGAANLATNFISSAKQKYGTVEQARKATAVNTISGMATGAQAGAQIGGPVGAAIGAGVGMMSGLIGGKNSVQDAGFYEDPTILYGTGIIGAAGRKSAQRRYEELLRKAIGNRNANAVGHDIEADWDLNNDSETNVFAANGGNIGDLAWLDDGEMFKTPDQLIYNVPEQGQPEDSNLLNIPEGTKVLSDKLKVPGTKETFAEMAKRLTSKKSKYNDKYALGAAEANSINDKQVFDTLFNIQEGMKGGKKEYKAGLPEFQGGGEQERSTTGNYGSDFVVDQFRGLGNRDNWIESAKWIVPILKWYDILTNLTNRKNSTAENPTLDRTNYQREWQNSVPMRPGEGVSGLNYPQGVRRKYNITTPTTQTVTETPQKVQEQAPLMSNYAATTPVTRSQSAIFTMRPQDWIGGNTISDLPTTSTPTLHDIAVQELSNPITSTTPVSTTYQPSESSNNRNPFDWAQLATDITSLLPVFANLGERPETFASVHNPYSNAALRTLANRRYDVRPTINQIRRNTASANYAMSQNNTNTGANLAFRLQNAVQVNNAANQAYATAADMNNTYATQYADMLNTVGNQYVDARNRAIEQNAQSRATARNINRTGLSQLSNYAQTRLRDRNQRLADQAMMDLYKPLLDVGFTPEQYARMFEQVSKVR